MLKPTATRPTQPYGHRLRERPADAAEACNFLREWFLVLVLSFFPSHFNTPPRRGGFQKSSLLRRFLEPRFAPSTSLAQIIGICLYAAMRSAGASLWRLTIPPFLPRMGDSFFREERSKEQTKSTGADSVCGPLSAAHPAAPESGKKMLPASKIPGGYSRPLCPGFAGANFAANGLREILQISPKPGARPMPYGHPNFSGRRRDYASAI